MRPSALLFAFAVVCGCAASTNSAPGRATETVRVAGSGIGMTIAPNTGANVTTIPFSSEQVWRTMPAVFEALGIPLTTVDPKKHLIGNEGFKLRQQLGTVRLSKYIECGTTQIGPNADSYEVYITIMTDVQAGESGGAKISTIFEASARPLNFAQEYSRCSSKGVLEPKIVEIATAKLQK
jgi:hypothetical protein